MWQRAIRVIESYGALLVLLLANFFLMEPIGLLFAFVFLACNAVRDAAFFAQPGAHVQSEYVYFTS